MVHRTFVLAVLCLIPAFPAGAQTSRDSAVLAAVSRLTPGDRIRVALLQERWTGPLRRVAGDTVFLGSVDPPMAIRFNAVDTLWRAGTAARRGALVGAITGGLAGGFAGLVIEGLGGAEGGTPLGLDPSPAFAGLMGAAAGAGIGLFAGAVIGKLTRRWKLVYP